MKVKLLKKLRKEANKFYYLVKYSSNKYEIHSNSKRYPRWKSSFYTKDEVFEKLSYYRREFIKSRMYKYGKLIKDV